MNAYHCLRTGNLHKSHRHLCDDYIESRISDELSLSVVCDGASSAAFAAIGAFYTARALITNFFENDNLSEFVTGNKKFKTLSREETINLFMQEEFKNELSETIVNIVHNTIGTLAKKIGVHHSQLSTTLIMVISVKDKTIVIHVGDGFVAATKNGTSYIISNPNNIENDPCRTHFITDFNALENLKISYSNTVFDTLLISSDGFYHVMSDDSDILNYTISKLQDIDIQSDYDLRKVLLSKQREIDFEELLYDDCGIIYLRNNERIYGNSSASDISDEISALKERIRTNAQNYTDSLFQLIDAMSHSNTISSANIKEVIPNDKSNKRKNKRTRKWWRKHNHI